MSRRTKREAADLATRYQQAIEDRDTAIDDNTGLLNTLKRKCAEITALRNEVVALSRELAESRTPDAGWLGERRDLRRRNIVLTQTVRGLEERLHMLQQANDALCREAADRAGTLRKVEVPA